MRRKRGKKELEEAGLLPEEGEEAVEEAPVAPVRKLKKVRPRRLAFRLPKVSR